MYVSKHHQLTDCEAIFSLVESHPLGAWVCHAHEGLVANHIPFFLDRTRGPHGTLMGHVARANTVWRQLGSGTPSVVMFQGTQSYISPGWYPGKAEHGQVVPTWNYVVAHAHGTARVMEDRDWLLGMLHRLTDSQEARQTSPWRVGDAPVDYIERMVRGIVGIEIPIDRLEGKLKASQDEDLQDRRGTVAGLQSNPSDASLTMAALVLSAMAGDAPQS
ncbi:FMN-binding negative transcriptional regulator [Rhodoferax sp.]|uniref:FMN-binding negative transcriptional regulator n=1 Tax=Rhodoferax sp. TaxID=50421 RepID=UPI0025D93373|nr:FMN-binding negative transcriptional regulator [Rhodoferax sp.]